MILYKLFRLKKNNKITSLFINKSKELELGKWLKSKKYPTKGFAIRPGWHCTEKPIAPHLSLKGRIWYKIQAKNLIEKKVPKNQGNKWYIAKEIKILEKCIV